MADRTPETLARRYLELLIERLGEKTMDQVRETALQPDAESRNPEERFGVDAGRIMRQAYVDLYGPDIAADDVVNQVDVGLIANKELLRSAFVWARRWDWRAPADA